jgi:adenosylhomocysteine nucleosidase
MLCLLFATLEEARPFLARYRGGAFRTLGADDVAQDDRVRVAVTGSGKIRATLRTEQLLAAHATDRLLHLGSCVALSDDLAPGDLLGVEHVLEGDRSRDLDVSVYPRMPLDLPFEVEHTGTLVTQDRGVDDADERAYWHRIADASDATGYAVAYVAARRGVPCFLAKAVAGRAGEPSDDLRADRAAAHEATATFALDAIDHFGAEDAA